MLKILAIERDETACNHYRILQPMAKLKEQALADVVFIHEDSSMAHERVMQNVLSADVILMPRPASEEWFRFLQLVRSLGKLIVTDYDDDPFNTSPLNPYYAFVGVEEVDYQWPDGLRERLWWDGMPDGQGNPNFFNIERNQHHRDMFRLNFKKADLVTCTTPILQQALQQINPRTIVLPNLLDLALYPKVEHVKRRIRIGWQGGGSHYEDLWLIHRVIAEVCRAHPEVTFVFFGDTRFYGLFKDVPAQQLEFQSWCRHNAYPYKLACLNLDIGLCPLTDNVFNRNKSAIKFLEYSAVGAATIASDIPPYQGVITNGRDGLLIPDDPAAWRETLESLISSAERRQRLAQQAYALVTQEYNADIQAHRWRDAYEQLMAMEPMAISQ